jgi:hypothetical protein
MARPSPKRKPASRSSGRGRRRKVRFTAWLPGAQLRRRWWSAFKRAPSWLQFFLCVVAVGVLWIATNGIYQVLRKPTELFFPVSGALYKTPTDTWDAYASLFRRHSTASITPELLAALAQVEGSGNPIVRTYWRWSWSARPFEIYRPASSAVGMYQLTDGTFDEARRWCIHDHVVVPDGPWHAWRSCWFNAFYARVIPSHAVEMTSADLDRKVRAALAEASIVSASLEQKQRLAAVIHLCGAGAGKLYARRGLKFSPAQRCGDHSAAEYVARVDAMRALFRSLDARR